MTRPPDVLARLAAADPVDATAPPTPAERTERERILTAVLAAPVERERRVGVRVPRLAPRAALAGAVLAAALVAVLVGTTRSGVEPARAAFAALSARTGVFHAVEQVTVTSPGRPPARAWVESWTSARGGRNHALRYDTRADGTRGRLVAESTDRATVIYASPRDRGPVGDGGLGPATGRDPRRAYLDAYREGRVRDAGRTSVRVRGRTRPAWRLIARRRLSPSLNRIDGREVRVPGYTERTVYLVDAESRSLLLERRTGLVGTERGYHRQTVTRRFVRFERLSDRAGVPGLVPTARFRG